MKTKTVVVSYSLPYTHYVRFSLKVPETADDEEILEVADEALSSGDLWCTDDYPILSDDYQGDIGGSGIYWEVENNPAKPEDLKPDSSARYEKQMRYARQAARLLVEACEVDPNNPDKHKLSEALELAKKAT